MQIQTVPNALVVSFGAGKVRGISRPAGVFDAEGKLIRRAICWRDGKSKVTHSPDTPEPDAVTENLRGKWLFGGMLYAHFGHFLCESTARLWPLNSPDLQFDGVLFYPKKQMTRDKKFLEPILPWLKIAGVEVPVRLAQSPLRVDQLLVPDQGFGLADMIKGETEYRAYVAAKFGAKVPAKGAARIYISRSHLFSKRGRILGELALERLLAAEGYTIYHPQEHPIEDQIAQYKAADVVISGDCSALHLAAFFAPKESRLAIIVRRPGATIDSFLDQYRAFVGIEPLVINRIRQLYNFDGAKLGYLGEVYSDVDFPAIQSALFEGGFIRRATGWADPTQAELAAELDDLSEKVGAPVQRTAPERWSDSGAQTRDAI